MSSEEGFAKTAETQMSPVELALTQRQYAPGVVSYMIANWQQRHEEALRRKGFDAAILNKILDDSKAGPGSEENALATLKAMGIEVPEDDPEYQAAQTKIRNYYELKGYQPQQF